jgi:hypothetical protein
MPSVTFDELVKAGKDMREKQKAYYRLHRDDAGKQTALTDSKLAERYFDSPLDRKQETQLDIFSVLNAEDDTPDAAVDKGIRSALKELGIPHPDDDTDPFPPIPQEPKSAADAAFDAAMRMAVEDGK